MLNILVIDDDSVKIGNVCNIIYEFSEIPKDNIDCVLEMRQAILKMQEEQYDLIILDIKLPRRIGNITTETGGIELLEAIQNTDRIKKPTCIIGLTAHNDLAKEHEKYFTDNVWSLLVYDSAEFLWKNQIRTKIKYLLYWKKQIINNIKNEREYNYDYAIITAVEPEYKAVLDLDFEWRLLNIENDCTPYMQGVFRTEDKEYKIVVAKQIQMGMSAATLLSAKLIYNFKPRYLCMLGIAAGRKDRVKLGDVLVAAESWDYGSGKIKESDDDSNDYLFEPEPHQISIDSKLKEIFNMDYSALLSDIRAQWNKNQGRHMDRDISVFLGPIASGAAVIQDEDMVKKYIDPQNRKLIGIDMETYGVYYAATNCSFPRPLFFSIKAVCDFADKSKKDDFQAYAAFISARFFKNIVNSLG